MTLLEIDKLSKKYHDNKSELVAIEDVSFELNNNEFLSIVGPSGCGKSTILSILAGITNKSDGKVSVNNNTSIGYMLQSDSLFPWKNVLDNCLIGLKIMKKLTRENKNYVIKLLNTYGLGDFIYKYPASLSGGMKQRVALIRTLAIKPDILLLDEAFSALDYQSRIKLRDDVYNILKKEGKSAIIVTHDIDEALGFSDKVIVLSNRPAKIKSIYKIDFKNRTIPSLCRKCPEYSSYYDMIWSDLNE